MSHDDQNPQDDHDGKKEINFKIDKDQFEIKVSQNPVTGEYLRGLPPVTEEYDLYRRGHGHQDDILIKPEDQVTVVNGEHFFTIKRVINPGS